MFDRHVEGRATEFIIFCTLALLFALLATACSDSSSRSLPLTAVASPPSQTSSSNSASSAGTSSPSGTPSPSGTTSPQPSQPNPAPQPATPPDLGSNAPEVTEAPNIWHLDFRAYNDQFFKNMVGHGLADASLGPKHPLNVWARSLVIRAALDRVNLAYRRKADGAKRSGHSFHAAFGAEKPAGRPGRNHSRICVGSTSSRPGRGALGIMPFDRGNRRAENACRLDRLGVLAGRIFGMNSWLSPKKGGPLKKKDLKFLDGSYALGSGTAAEDKRFRNIRKVVNDWGTAIGNVAAHEIGHSVGLLHDDNSRNLMVSRIQYRMLSDEKLSFASRARRILSRNLGISK